MSEPQLPNVSLMLQNVGNVKYAPQNCKILLAFTYR